MTDELKPVRCGCGGEAEIFHIAPDGYAGSYCVRCVDCLTQSPFFTGNKEKAIEVWNRAMGADQFRDLTKKMSDLISRQDAINAMMVLKRADDLAYGCEIPESFDSERAIEALKNIPSAEPERKWIPVSEALPEERKNVLVTTIDGDIKVSYRSDVTYWWNIGRGKVIAWMPLPEPWREEVQ